MQNAVSYRNCGNGGIVDGVVTQRAPLHPSLGERRGGGPRGFGPCAHTWRWRGPHTGRCRKWIEQDCWSCRRAGRSLKTDVGHGIEDTS